MHPCLEVDPIIEYGIYQNSIHVTRLPIFPELYNSHRLGTSLVVPFHSDFSHESVASMSNFQCLSWQLSGFAVPWKLPEPKALYWAMQIASAFLRDEIWLCRRATGWFVLEIQCLQWMRAEDDEFVRICRWWKLAVERGDGDRSPIEICILSKPPEQSMRNHFQRTLNVQFRRQSLDLREVDWASTFWFFSLDLAESVGVYHLLCWIGLTTFRYFESSVFVDNLERWMKPSMSIEVPW